MEKLGDPNVNSKDKQDQPGMVSGESGTLYPKIDFAPAGSFLNHVESDDGHSETNGQDVHQPQ